MKAALRIVAFAVVAAACDEAAPAPARAGAAAAPAASPADSIYARDVELFVAGLPRVDALRSDAGSRGELVVRFLRAVERRDSAELARLVVDRAEFAYLYYPHTRFTKPPYRMSPATLWFLIQNNSSRGAYRLLTRYGGTSFAGARQDCPAEPLIEGPNRLWERCIVMHAAAPAGERLFGSILERDGRFSFLSYANEL